MEEIQVRDLLKTLRNRYPEYYARKEKDEIVEIYNSFVIALKDIAQISVVGALNVYLNTDKSGYPPTAAQLRAKANSMPDYMWRQELETQEQIKLAIERPKKTRREVLLHCAALIACDTNMESTEQLVWWWNTKADPNTPLTDQEIEQIWSEANEEKSKIC